MADLPSIPPALDIVHANDVIRSVHENAVSTAIADLWTDVQWLRDNAYIDPTTTKGDLLTRTGAALARLPVGADGQLLIADSSVPTGLRWGAPSILVGAGLSGGGALSGNVTLSANVTSVFGRTGAVVLTGAEITGAGGVLATRQVNAGAGLAGGGNLGADITLTANVVTVFGRTGNVVLTGTEVAGAGGVLTTRAINTGAGLSGGGDLSANRTLVADVQTVFGRTGAVVLTGPDISGAGGVLTTRQVIAGAGLGGGGTLAGDVTLTANVTSVFGRTGAVVLTGGEITGAGGVLGTRQVIAGAGLSGGGDLSADVTLTANVTSVFGRTGAVALTAADVTGVGGVLGTRNIIAGAGLGGGGNLSGDVTLTANVTSVFGRTGAVVLTATEVTGVGGVLNTRQVIAGTGLTGGGDLSADRTLSVAPDTTKQRVEIMRAGVSIGTRPTINFIQGSNTTLTVSDSGVNNRVDITIAATAGGGSQTPWSSNIDAAGYSLNNVNAVNHTGTRPTLYFNFGSGTYKSRILQPVAEHRMDLVTNATFDGTQWVRDDTASYGALAILKSFATGATLTLNYADLTGTNPAFNPRFTFDIANNTQTIVGSGTVSPCLTFDGGFGTRKARVHYTFDNIVSMSVNAYTDNTGAWYKDDIAQNGAQIYISCNGGTAGVVKFRHTPASANPIGNWRSSFTFDMTVSQCTIGSGDNNAPAPWILFDRGSTGRARIGNFGNPAVSHRLDIAHNAYYNGSAWVRDDSGSWGLIMVATAGATAGSWSWFTLDASNSTVNKAALDVYGSTFTIVQNSSIAPNSGFFRIAQGSLYSRFGTSTNIVSVSDWSYNLYWDGSNWQRDSTGAAASMIRQYQGTSINFSYAAAGANPIGASLNQPFTFDLVNSRLGIGTGVTSPSYMLHLGSDSAAKPTTSTWTVTSDVRTKRSVEEFSDGLDKIRQLRPIRYEYNGLAATPDGAQGIGFEAQDIEPHAPYMVGSLKRKLRQDDAEESDVKHINYHALFLLLVNAVKELDGRLDRLERGRS